MPNKPIVHNNSNDIELTSRPVSDKSPVSHQKLTPAENCVSEPLGENPDQLCGVNGDNAERSALCDSERAAGFILESHSEGQQNPSLSDIR